jgi:hypothetical protein
VEQAVLQVHRGAPDELVGREVVVVPHLDLQLAVARQLRLQLEGAVELRRHRVLVRVLHVVNLLLAQTDLQERVRQPAGVHGHELQRLDDVDADAVGLGVGERVHVHHGRRRLLGRLGLVQHADDALEHAAHVLALVQKAGRALAAPQLVGFEGRALEVALQLRAALGKPPAAALHDGLRVRVIV